MKGALGLPPKSGNFEEWKKTLLFFGGGGIEMFGKN